MELSRILLTTRQLTRTIEPNLKGEAKVIFKQFYDEVNKISANVANDILNDNKNPNLDINILKQTNSISPVDLIDHFEVGAKDVKVLKLREIISRFEI